ncbi:hypothetical protein Gpo141_00006957 [Globisporangium polare]
MAATNPTADEDVIALVGDGGMQQLIAHAQAQEAQAQALAQAQAQQHHALTQQAVEAAAAAVADDVAAMAATADAHMASAGLSKVDSGAMDFMPLSAAGVVLGSPSAGAGAPGLAGDGGVAGVDSSTSVGTNANLAIKRKSIPLSMKKEAIEWIMGPGKGIPSRAEKHFSALNWDVSASSFRKWWKNREKILGDSSHKKRITGGGRKPYLENSEEKLLVIVIQERAKKDRVTRKWIAKTAQHMFQRTNANFKASENWVTKFIRRNGLTLKRSYVTYEQQQQHPASAAASGLEHVGDDGEPQPEGHIEIDDDEDVDGGLGADEQDLDRQEHQETDVVMEASHEERKA